MTDAVWTIMPGLKLPVPRSAAPIATMGNCSAIAGMNHEQIVGRRSAAVAASAPSAFTYGTRSADRHDQKQHADEDREQLRLR